MILALAPQLTDEEDDLVPITLPCRHCRDPVQRTILYLKSCRFFFCENCGKSFSYEGTLI